MLRPHSSRTRLAQHCTAALRPAPNGLLLPQTYYARHAFSTKDSNVKSVAVLGGGITGLTAAFYLSKKAPGLPVTIYESSSRLGGWIRTKSIETKGGRVLFESGPRTIRTSGDSFLVTLDMIRQLDLGDEAITITSASHAAKDRYIYYPDKIVHLPKGLLNFTVEQMSEPLFRGIWGGIFGEIFRSRRGKDVTDESVGSWISRRLNPRIAQNIASAVFHGIYAGDIDRLSARSIIPSLWRLEEAHGSVSWGFLSALMGGGVGYPASDWKVRRELAPLNKWHLMQLRKEHTVMVSFVKGMETLTSRLVRYLEKAPNVRIRTNSTVKSLVKKNQMIEVQLAKNLPPTSHTHVISTLPAPITSSLLPTPIPSLSTLESVTVQVVNLFFLNPSLLNNNQGFGYLIPKSVAPHLNPENGLGVIFDNAIIPSPAWFPRVPRHAKGTFLTVMMGGHYWTGRASPPPSDAEAVANACSLLKRHLGIVDPPELTQVTTQVDAIPQYTVGHHDRMAFAHELMKMNFDGRVAVAGASYEGVGINDCAKSAYQVVGELLEGAGKGAEAGEWTGLGRFAPGGGEMVRLGGADLKLYPM